MPGMTAMQRPVARDSDEWNKRWGQLDAALKLTPLPTEDGNTVQCDLGDFMLVGVDDATGAAHFKNTVTRNYLYVGADGKLEIPTGGSFRLGFFAHCG